MAESLNSQKGRRRATGFLSSVIVVAVDSLVNTLRKGDMSGGRSRKKTCPVVILYAHKSSHNLKKVGDQYSVYVAFLGPRKLGSLCASTDEMQSERQGYVGQTRRHIKI